MSSIGARTLSTYNIDAGSIIAGRYTVHSQIGSGGMGVVLRVSDHDLDDEDVALKVLHPHLAQDDVVFRRFRNEVLIARTLTHPNIVRTHDIGREEEAGYSYISMELIDGQTLKEKLLLDEAGKEGIPLPFGTALEILIQILSGMSYAHKKDVIHRDLKPANILIDSHGEVKIGDFGTARIVGMDTSLTQSGQMVGTPDYMSPEQVRGESLDARCDIYSLGIIGYVLVTGKKPFVADSPVAVAYKQINEPLPDFADSNRGIPAWYEQIIKKACAKDRNERYANATEYLAAILQHAPSTNAQGTVMARTQVYRDARKEELEAAPEHFELGGEGATVERDAWSLGNIEDDEAVAVERNRTPLQILVLFVSLFLSLFLLTVLAVRISPNMQQYAKTSLDGAPEGSAFSSGALRSLLGLPATQPQTHASSTVPVTAAKQGQQEELKDLLGFDPTTGQEAAPTKQATVPSVAAENKNTSGEVVSAVSKEAPPAVEKSSLVPTTTTPEDSATKTTASEQRQVAPVEEKTPDAIPLTPLRASLSVLKGNRVIEGAQSVADVEQLRWEAEISGGEPVKNEVEMRKQFYANVFDLNAKRVVAKLPIDRVELGTDGAAMVGASLRQFARVKPESGSYRIDLVRDGEHLSSAELLLYKAEVVLGQQRPSVESGAQKVSIVRGPAYIPAETEEQRTGPAAAAVARTEEPSFPPAADLPDNQAIAPGLPPAKGYERSARREAESFERQSTLEIFQQGGSGDEGFGREEKPQAPGITYGGSFTLGSDIGGSQDTRAFRLTLSQSGEEISGSAEIDGMGSFQVQGRELARGLELSLANESMSFRMSGRRKGNGLRGSFFIPGKPRGSWQVSR